MNETERSGFIAQLNARWRIDDQGRLSAEYTFKDFANALGWVNRIGALAEEEDHHPDLALGWGRVGVTLYTHSINGLSENDFRLAAKIDRLG